MSIWSVDIYWKGIFHTEGHATVEAENESDALIKACRELGKKVENVARYKAEQVTGPNQPLGHVKI